MNTKQEQLINWDEVPEILSKEQFYKLCHISKSTALHLLRNGIVPCVDSGMKTRCYKIKKADVQDYLSKRAIFPEAYSAPSGWYCNNKKTNTKRVPPKVLDDMAAFYTEKLQGYRNYGLCRYTRTEQADRQLPEQQQIKIQKNHSKQVRRKS